MPDPNDPQSYNNPEGYLLKKLLQNGVQKQGRAWPDRSHRNVDGLLPPVNFTNSPEYREKFLEAVMGLPPSKTSPNNGDTEQPGVWSGPAPLPGHPEYKPGPGLMPIPPARAPGHPEYKKPQPGWINLGGRRPPASYTRPNPAAPRYVPPPGQYSMMQAQPPNPPMPKPLTPEEQELLDALLRKPAVAEPSRKRSPLLEALMGSGPTM